MESGDLLLLDFGAMVRGYCSDLTRTVVVGSAPDARQQECYDAVRTAQQAAMLANYVRQARSSAWMPIGAFEAVSRKVDKEYRVYARFVGGKDE